MNNQAETEVQPNEYPALRKLAFVSLVELSKDVFRGGVLVTDAQGKPLEFRCTSAIQPTPVQKTLYGNTLKAHMSVELTARPLLASVKELFDAVFVEQDDFMEIRNVINKPLLVVAKQGETIAVQFDPETSARGELLTSPSGKFEPVVLTCHWQHASDLDDSLSDLGTLFARFDLTEPFVRIANAVRQLHEKGAVPIK